MYLHLQIPQINQWSKDILGNCGQKVVIQVKVGQGHLIQESGGCHRSDLVVGQISVSTDRTNVLVVQYSYTLYSKNSNETITLVAFEQCRWCNLTQQSVRPCWTAYLWGSH